MCVGSRCSIILYPLVCTAFAEVCSVGVGCMVSSPYSSFDFMMASKTRSFHLVVVSALFQKISSLLAIASASPIRALISVRLSASSVRSVPRYLTCDFRGTSSPFV